MTHQICTRSDLLAQVEGHLKRSGLDHPGVRPGLGKHGVTIQVADRKAPVWSCQRRGMWTVASPAPPLEKVVAALPMTAYVAGGMILVPVRQDD